eukprot:c20557_g1_i1.p1 GENE.c20557_g1_i1~~c20557_g1_i1.p1  ORF type:complete len:617 (-),score=219.58 c20557_g1_i1:108-1958(-)
MADSTIRISSLNSREVFPPVVKKLPDIASSICLEYFGNPFTEGETNFENVFLQICVGQNSGLMLRGNLDVTNGAFLNPRSHSLGNRPIKFFRVKLHDNTKAMVALSSRTWLCYEAVKQFHSTPLGCPPLQFGCFFTSSSVPGGIASIHKNTLHILSIDRMNGVAFSQITLPLRHTPRHSLIHPIHKTLIILESDHKGSTASNVSSSTSSSSSSSLAVNDSKQRSMMEIDEIGGKSTENGINNSQGQNNVLPIPGMSGTWGSCIHIIDPNLLTAENKKCVYELVEFEPNEAVLNFCLCSFSERNNDIYLCVGVAQNLKILQRTPCIGMIKVYKFEQGGKKLVLEHSTLTDDSPTALAQFQGRLLVGVGKSLRIYDIGKQKLLKQCENKNFKTKIISIHVEKDRIIVGDISQSFTFCQYQKETNSLEIFAEDNFPRWLTASCLLDSDTIAGADKFGNFFVLSLPPDVSEQMDIGALPSQIKWTSNGEIKKLDLLVHSYSGDLITSMTKAVLVNGGHEVIVCGTISGALISFLPITTRSDFEFLTGLEIQMRQECPPLCGSDHLDYRGYYFALKNVVDGNLCEQFFTFSDSKQNEIASSMKNVLGQMKKTLEDIRSHVL